MIAAEHRYSSKVVIFLCIAGMQLDLAQVCSTHCVVREPIDVDACDAELIIKIDDHEIREQIHLLDGITKRSKVVRYF